MPGYTVYWRKKNGWRYSFTYVRRDAEQPAGIGEIKRFRREFSRKSCYRFWTSCSGSTAYGPSGSWHGSNSERVHPGAPFPFGVYRPGQREMAAAVYRTIAASGRLFSQAPTGIGKTVSTLFPAVKSLGEGLADRLFYLTAKTITRQAAEQALARMEEQGLRLKSVTLTAQDKICFLEERRSAIPTPVPMPTGISTGSTTPYGSFWTGATA